MQRFFTTFDPMTGKTGVLDQSSPEQNDHLTLLIVKKILWSAKIGRGWSRTPVFPEKYHERQKDCPFCEVKRDQIIKENNLGYLIFDKFPVTEYHSLIIPKRHFTDYFDTTQAEFNAISFLLNFGKDYLFNMDSSIQGFNVGINSGTVAGQTVPHCHTHLIPRRAQDVSDPKGGVRHIIPNKGFY